MDGEIKRVHIPGAGRRYRGQARTDLDWVFRRFARKPFDERFKESKFQAPEKMMDGNTRVVVDKLRYLVADNQITGIEFNVGTEAKPNHIRMVYGAGELGGGYGILEESYSHRFGGIETKHMRKLTVGSEKGIPVPALYESRTKGRIGTRVRRIKFSASRLNATHPIAVDAAALELVKEAFERHYTWPAGLRFEGSWAREVDNATAKGGYTRKVKGGFQLLAGVLELTLDEDVRVSQRWRKSILESVTGDLRASFKHLMPTTFEQAYPGCGFQSDAEAGDGVVRVIGHPTILALRIETGAIVGTRTDEFGGEAWWDYRLKKLPDGRMRLERMTRKIGKKKRTMKFSYSTKKGVQVLKSAERIVRANAWGGGEPDNVGVIKYALKKLFVQVKD